MDETTPSLVARRNTIVLMLYRIPDDKDKSRFDNLNLTKQEVKHMTNGTIAVLAGCLFLLIICVIVLYRVIKEYNIDYKKTELFSRGEKMIPLVAGILLGITAINLLQKFNIL